MFLTFIRKGTRHIVNSLVAVQFSQWGELVAVKETGETTPFIGENLINCEIRQGSPVERFPEMAAVTRVKGSTKWKVEIYRKGELNRERVYNDSGKAVAYAEQWGKNKGLEVVLWKR